MPSTKPNIAALVEQMPETDREVQAKQEEARQQAQPDPATQPKPKPDRWGAASKFTGPDPRAAEKIFSEILGRGRESLLELINLVREPADADYKNYKASYVLHGLVIYVGATGREDQRRLLVQSLAAQLGNDKHSNAVKGTFIRALRVLGGEEVVRALGQQLLDDLLSGDATAALLSIRDGAPAQFRRALDKAKGRNRLAILQACGILQDKAAAGALKKALTDDERDVRLTAAWALANLGQANVAGALMQMSDRAVGWERSQATKACLLLAERLAASNQKPQAAAVYMHLRETRTDPSESHVREAAQRALSAMPRA